MIHETCSCGAEIKVQGSLVSFENTAIREFREAHKECRAIVIDKHRPVSVTVSGDEVMVFSKDKGFAKVGGEA